MRLKPWSLSRLALTDNFPVLLQWLLQPRDPWLSYGLCCPTESTLTMVSSETLVPLATLFSSSSKSLPYYLVWAGNESFPNFLCISFPSCYIPYPGALNDCFRLLLRRLHWLSPCSDRLSLRTPPDTLVLIQADYRGCKFRFMLQPDGLLALHQQGLLLSSFHYLSHLKIMSNITTRINSQFP